jgi:hypothetical protein
MILVDERQVLLEPEEYEGTTNRTADKTPVRITSTIVLFDSINSISRSV